MAPSFVRRLIGITAAILVISLAFLLSSGNDSALAEGGDYDASLTAFNCISSWPPGDPFSCSPENFTPATTSNTATFLDIPTNNFNFSLLVTFVPEDATVATSAAIPEGAMMGALRSGTTLGIANGTCGPAKGLSVDFAFFNASIDDSSGNLIDPTTVAAAGPQGTLEPLRNDTNPTNSLPDHVDRYPSYIKALLDPDLVSLGADGLLGGGDDTNGAQAAIVPRARYSSATIVSGTAIILQFIVLDKGAFQAYTDFNPTHPLADLNDTKLGYPTLVVLNDPFTPLSPGSITDFCAPIASRTQLFGVSRDNPCTPHSAGTNCDDAPNTNAKDAKKNTPPDGTLIPPALWGGAADACDFDTDESGCDRLTNPAAGTGFGTITTGTHLALSFTQSLRDLDNDGLENPFDTCATDNVAGFNPRSADALRDFDNDRIPGQDDTPGVGPAGALVGGTGCDPTPEVNTTSNGSNNHDGDESGNPLLPWVNAQDNCPLIANNDQQNTELDTAWAVAIPNGGPRDDGMGDICDASDTVSNGHYHTTLTVTYQCIAVGNDSLNADRDDNGDPDNDDDGVCDGTEEDLGSYMNSPASTPEHLSLQLPFPVTESGSGNDADGDGITDADEPGPADDDAYNTSAGQKEEPLQQCNDNRDNDLDTVKDEIDCDADFGGGGDPDDDLDTYPDATETACGSGGDPSSTDPAETPERKSGVDDDGDTSVDNDRAVVAGVDCDGDGFKDDLESGLVFAADDGDGGATGAESGAQCWNVRDDDADTVVNDGCTTAAFGHDGTDHQERCNDTTTKDDEENVWPPDFNDDRRLNISDVTTFAFPVRHIGKSVNDPVTNAHAHWNLGGGSSINIGDVSKVGAAFLKPTSFYNLHVFNNTVHEGTAGRCAKDNFDLRLGVDLP